MFIEVVRRHLESLPAQEAGWLAGLRDPFVGKALSLIHAAPALNWTIEKLAKDVGLSRSVLAQRFAHLVGMPPMQYLAKWRMQIASGLLSDGSANVATVAAEIGYASEAAFSRAFKKMVGNRPRIGVAASCMMVRIRCCEPSDRLLGVKDDHDFTLIAVGGVVDARIAEARRLPHFGMRVEDWAPLAVIPHFMADNHHSHGILRLPLTSALAQQMRPTSPGAREDLLPSSLRRDASGCRADLRNRRQHCDRRGIPPPPSLWQQLGSGSPNDK